MFSIRGRQTRVAVPSSGGETNPQRGDEDEVKAMRDALNRPQRDTEEAASHHEIVKRKLEAVIHLGYCTMDMRCGSGVIWF
jgi:hypothetical protein